MHGKGGRSRTILLDDPALVALIRRYLRATGYTHGPLFRAANNHVDGPLRYASAQELWTKYNQLVGENISLHQLRHTHATELVNDGVSLQTIRKRLGHGKIQTTLGYANTPTARPTTSYAGGAAGAASELHPQDQRGLRLVTRFLPTPLILTLAIAEIIQQLAESWEPVTGRSNGMYGIPATRLAGEALTNVANLYWYILGCFLAGLVVLWLVSASPFGATLRGIRDNEPRMRALGYHPYRYKLAAFVTAGAIAGLAGGLLAAQQRLVTPADLGFTTSALALLAVVIGGTGTIWGPCLGAALVVLVRDSLGPSLGGHGPLVLGLVFIAVVYALPRGVAALRRPRRAPGGGQ